MSLRALSYRTPSAESVRAQEWNLVLDGGEIPLPEAYPHWDYSTDVELRRIIDVDLERVLAESGLSSDTPLILAVVWTSTGSRLKGTAMRTIVTGAGQIDIRARLSGADLGGTLILDTALVLASRREGRDRPTAARRAGSVLWSDRHRLRLQGDAPQFPIAVIDFSRTVHPDDAAWHLEIGPNLDAATMGSLLLLVNEKSDFAASAVVNAGNPRTQDKLVFSMLYADVARIMVDHALSCEEFVDEAVFKDETLGQTFRQLLERLFPGRSITDIRLRAREAPNAFASELQAAVKIFEGVQ